MWGDPKADDATFNEFSVETVMTDGKDSNLHPFTDRTIYLSRTSVQTYIPRKIEKKKRLHGNNRRKFVVSQLTIKENSRWQ